MLIAIRKNGVYLCDWTIENPLGAELHDFCAPTYRWIPFDVRNFDSIRSELEHAREKFKMLIDGKEEIACTLDDLSLIDDFARDIAEDKKTIKELDDALCDLDHIFRICTSTQQVYEDGEANGTEEAVIEIFGE